jgi:hypothetical protein
MKLRSIFAVLLTFHAACLFTFGNEPDLYQATLEWQGRSLSPVDIVTPWRQQNIVGNKLVDLDGTTVTARERTTHNVIWTTECADAKSTQWLGSNDDVAYIQVFNYREDPDSRVPVIRTISLEDGHWVQSIVIPDATNADVLLGLLAGKDLTFVMSATLKADKEWPHDKQMTNYRVTAFAVKTGQPMWTQSFSASPEFSNSDPLLMATKRPNQAVPGIRALSLLGDNILACAGPRQAIVCLHQKDGKQAWIQERVWEYERGFIGPSVWSHFIARHGALREDSKKVDSKLSTDFDQRWSCNIVGGPVVVELQPNKWSQHPAAVFVAVGKARADGNRSMYRSYLQDCEVYELADDGTVVSLTNLPRMVEGSQCQILDDGLVWACQNNALLRLGASGRNRGIIGVGSGGPDMIGKVTWYREYDPQEPEEWLVTDKAGDPIAYEGNRCFRVLSGGFVRSDAKKLFSLPIALFDLADGKRDDFVLKVPMASEVALPTTNYSGEPGKHCHTIGPYLFGITGLRTDGDLLSVTLGMENWSAIVTFNLASPNPAL